MHLRHFPRRVLVRTFVAGILLASVGIVNAAALDTLKNARVGMTMAEVLNLQGGPNAFSGDAMRCTDAGALQHCGISNSSIANISAEVEFVFVRVGPPGPRRTVSVPPKYSPTAAEIRLLEPEEIAAKKAKLDQRREALLRESRKATYESQGSYKLAYIFVVIAHDSYDALRNALSEKYGSVGRSTVDTYQTAMNAKYEGTSTVWEDVAARVSLTERCDRIDRSCLMMSEKSLMTKVQTIWADQQHARQRDL